MPNRIDIYNKTVDVLYAAYFNDTLVHGNQCGCAFGNIVADVIGYKVIITERNGEPYAIWEGNKNKWSGEWYDIITGMDSPEGCKQIEATGYTVNEVIRIENAFEGAEDPNISTEEQMLNGLVAVLEVLKDIHEIREEEHATNKYKFAHLYTEKQLAHV